MLRRRSEGWRMARSAGCLSRDELFGLIGASGGRCEAADVSAFLKRTAKRVAGFDLEAAKRAADPFVVSGRGVLALAEGLIAGGLKAEWYDWEFWNAFCVFETGFGKKNWDDPSLAKGVVSQSYGEKRTRWLLETEHNGLFEGLSRFLSESPIWGRRGLKHESQSLFDLWVKLAERKENKDKLRGMPLPKFVMRYDSPEKQAKVLRSFGTEEALEAIRLLYEANSENGTLEPKLMECLLAAGGNAKERSSYGFFDAKPTKLIWRMEANLNSEGAIRTGMIGRREGEYFFKHVVAGLLSKKGFSVNEHCHGGRSDVVGFWANVVYEAESEKDRDAAESAARCVERAVMAYLEGYDSLPKAKTAELERCWATLSAMTEAEILSESLKKSMGGAPRRGSASKI